MYVSVFSYLSTSRYGTGSPSRIFLLMLCIGLLQTLEDCGSPPLANRAPSLSPPNSLKTSDHKSMMAFMGLPLDVFGKVRVLPLISVELILYVELVHIGCFLSTLPSFATNRYDQEYTQLALWEYQLHCNATEGY